MRRGVMAGLVLLIVLPLAVPALAAPADVPRARPTWQVETGQEAVIDVSGNGQYAGVLADRGEDWRSGRTLTLLGGDGERRWEHAFPQPEQVWSVVVTNDGDAFCGYVRWGSTPLPEPDAAAAGAYRFSPSGGLLWKTNWAGKAGFRPWDRVVGVAKGPSGFRVLVAESDFESITSAAVIAHDGKVLSKFNARGSGVFDRLALAPDGSYILCSARDRLVGRRLDFSEIWHRDGLTLPLEGRPMSADGNWILAQGVGPFITPKWDNESGRLAGSLPQMYSGEAFGWAVLNGIGKPQWGYGAYQVTFDQEGLQYGYTGDLLRDVEGRSVDQAWIGGRGGSHRVLMVEGLRRTLLGAGPVGNRPMRELLHFSLPPLSSEFDETALSADGTRVACLAITPGAEDTYAADLTVFDGDGKPVWASLPGSLVKRGAKGRDAHLFLSDDGRFVLLHWANTLLAFSEPRAAATP